MKNFLLSLLVVFTFLSVNSYAAWDPTYAEYPKCIGFADVNTGWAGATGGKIYKTTDAGVSWVEQTSGATCDITCISVVSSSEVYMCGYEYISSVYHGRLLKTTDGGTNWTVITDPVLPIQRPLIAVNFVTASIGYIGFNMGGQSLYRTTDGGDNWTLMTTTGSWNVSSIHVRSSNVGVYACSGFGKIYYTSNGTTWTQATTPASDGSYDIMKIQLVDDLIGYAVGTSSSVGFVWKTVNGGSSWSAVTSPSASYLQSISFPTATVGYASGATNAGYNIWKTTDGGTSWANESYINNSWNWVNAIEYVNASHIFALSGSSIYKYSIPPTIITRSISGITLNSATSGGNITDGGSSAITASGIVYATTANPEVGGTGVINLPTSPLKTSGSFITDLTSLSEGTYHVRAYATNTGGTSYGADVYFTTIPTLPEWALIAFVSLIAVVGGVFVWKKFA